MDLAAFKARCALSEEDLKKSYAKFITGPVPEPDPALLAQFEQPLDPKEAILGPDMHHMLDPDFTFRNGWCHLPGGGSYSACLTLLPEVTPEMWAWFFKWWTSEDPMTRYKVWYPPTHYLCYGDFDSGRNWIVEAYDPQKPFFATGSGFPIQWLGFSQEQLEKSPCLTRGGSVMLSKFADEDFAAPPLYGCNCHFVFPYGKGISVRSLFWLGHLVSESQGLHTKLFPGQQVPQDMPKSQIYHCACEMTNMKAMLPALYAQEAGK